MEASTPRLCSSSVIRARHCRPKPFWDRYQPPTSTAEIASMMRKRSAVTARRHAKDDCRPCKRRVVFGGGGSRTAAIIHCYETARRNQQMRQSSSTATVPRGENRRSARDQCLAQFDQHDLHLRRLVLDSAQCLATACPVHDSRVRVIDPSRHARHLCED